MIKNTSKEEIDAIVNNISDSYEIILDNDFELDETLNERKKKRLRALENYETDIVVKVNLDLDQTVDSAEEEFEQFDCVVEAEENFKCETSGLTSDVNDIHIAVSSIIWIHVILRRHGIVLIRQDAMTYGLQ